MRVSKFFGETLRDVPAEADTTSYALLLRAGYIRQLAAGIFSYLPLAQRSLKKIEQILREEMDAIGGQEINMPVVHPGELWQQTGRWDAIDATMVRFKDRRDRDMLLAMTHEEVVAALAHSEIRSYRQLPQLVYQLQTKFRDEPRARGGLIRVREFVMKDSYSLDLDQAGLEVQYVRHYDAYHRIGARTGVPLAAVQSDVGMMGGKVAHEFMYVTPIGEDSLVLCEACGYAANLEVSAFRKHPIDKGSPQPLERVHTPGHMTIEAVASFLGVEKTQTAKMVFYMGDYGPDAPARLVVGVVRGDMEVNLIRLKYLAGARDLRPAHPEEIEAVGAVPGYASPRDIDRTQAMVIVDDLVTHSANLVVGANEKDYHLRNANYGRDYEADVVGAIAAAYEGAPCANCGEPVHIVRGVEVGNIFQLGTRYSEALEATYTDEHGAAHPIIMGSYGIGVGRLLACVAEEHNDERGLTLPIAVAPFHVGLVALVREEETREKAEALYQALLNAGVEVLYDDRDATAGVKFADADLRGLPLRLTISERSLQQGGVECKRRTEKAFEIIPLDDIVAHVQQECRALFEDLATRLGTVPTWAREGG